MEVPERLGLALRRASTEYVAVPVMAAIVVIAITVAWLNWRSDTTVEPSSGLPSPSAAPSDTDESPNREGLSEAGMEVLVMGDSSATGRVGHKPEWPDILAEQRGWDMVEDVVAGSGYLAAGRGRPFFPRMVDQLQEVVPGLVILAGGYADVRLDGVTTAAIVNAVDRLVKLVRAARPRAEVVIISPSASAGPGPRTVALARALKRYADRERITYVGVTGVLLDRSNRARAVGIRPSAVGHEKLAAAIDAALNRAAG